MSDGIYSRNRWEKAYYNRPNISFRKKNLNSIIAEALNIEENILFNDNH